MPCIGVLLKTNGFRYNDTLPVIESDEELSMEELGKELYSTGPDDESLKLAGKWSDVVDKLKKLLRKKKVVVGCEETKVHLPYSLDIILNRGGVTDEHTQKLLADEVEAVRNDFGELFKRLEGNSSCKCPLDENCCVSWREQVNNPEKGLRKRYTDIARLRKMSEREGFEFTKSCVRLTFIFFQRLCLFKKVGNVISGKDLKVVNHSMVQSAANSQFSELSKLIDRAERQKLNKSKNRCKSSIAQLIELFHEEWLIISVDQLHLDEPTRSHLHRLEFDLLFRYNGLVVSCMGIEASSPGTYKLPLKDVHSGMNEIQAKFKELVEGTNREENDLDYLFEDFDQSAIATSGKTSPWTGLKNTFAQFQQKYIKRMAKSQEKDFAGMDSYFVNSDDWFEKDSKVMPELEPLFEAKVRNNLGHIKTDYQSILLTYLEAEFNLWRLSVLIGDDCPDLLAPHSKTLEFLECIDKLDLWKDAIKYREKSVICLKALWLSNAAIGKKSFRKLTKAPAEDGNKNGNLYIPSTPNYRVLRSVNEYMNIVTMDRSVYGLPPVFDSLLAECCPIIVTRLDLLCRIFQLQLISGLLFPN